MFCKTVLTSAALTLAAGAVHAATVNPTFIDYGTNTTTAENTRLYRADLTGYGLIRIAAITITDSNSQTGGSPGPYSGFDLDAIFLDIDGDVLTTADRITAASFMFTAGTLRPGATQPNNTSGPTNGSTGPNSFDNSFATLGAVDAQYFDTGSLTLGDGGSLTALFSPDVLVGASLYLFVGEVSGDFGEFVNSSIEVSDIPPAVPLPASALLLLSGVGLIAARRRKKA